MSTGNRRFNKDQQGQDQQPQHIKNFCIQVTKVGYDAEGHEVNRQIFTIRTGASNVKHARSRLIGGINARFPCAEKVSAFRRFRLPS